MMGKLYWPFMFCKNIPKKKKRRKIVIMITILHMILKFKRECALSLFVTYPRSDKEGNKLEVYALIQ